MPSLDVAAGGAQAWSEELAVTDLTPAELHQLTGQKKPEKQAAALVALGIPFRAAGRALFVAREIAQHWPQWQARQTGVRMDLVR